MIDEIVNALDEGEPAEEHDSAEEILDQIEDDKWAYAGAESIELVEAGTDQAEIKTTKVLYDGTPVTRYRIYFSDSTLATQEFDKIQDVIVDATDDAEDTEKVVLTLGDLTADTTYYIVVAPVHPTDETIEPLTMITEELSFKTDTQATDPNAKMFENVSYTYSDNTVTLTWTPTGSATTAEVHIRHQGDASYTKVGSPKHADGKFVFTVTKSGNYFLKLIALDSAGAPVGKEHVQTIKIDEVTEPEVQTTPQVGPTTDAILAIMILAVIAYLVFRFRRIER